MTPRRLLCIGAVFCLLNGLMASDTDTLKEAALETLWQVLKSEQGWPKVHAAEALIDCEHAGEVRNFCETFSPERPDSGFPLIGYYRVMARCGSDLNERTLWLDHLKRRAFDFESPLQVFAIESLAKLQAPLIEEERLKVREFIRIAKHENALFGWWLLASTDTTKAQDAVREALTVKEVKSRSRAALVLRMLNSRDPRVLEQLLQAIKEEPHESPATPYLIAAAACLDRDPARLATWQARLEEIFLSENPASSYQAALALMKFTPLISPESLRLRLTNSQPDIRVGTAWLILKSRGLL